MCLNCGLLVGQSGLAVLAMASPDLPRELSLERLQGRHNSRPGKYNDVLT